MKIGIDARFFGPYGKGLGRYTQKLIENLERIDNKNQYVIFLRKENWDSYTPNNKNFKKEIADYRWYSLSEQFNMPKVLKKAKLDLVHFPHFNVPLFYRRNFVVTIHDLILTSFPTQRATTLHPLLYKIKHNVYKIIIKSAVKRAKKIITVSNFSKNELIKQFKIDPKKIVVTYEATEYVCKEVEQKNLEDIKKFGISKPYLLYVGNAYPHKNLERLLQVFKKLKKDYQDIELVLVGKKDYFFERLQRKKEKMGLNGVIFTGYVEDEDLPNLYKNASLYVFPSLCEGFGLPPLEAMTCGVPVCSSNKSCLPEVLGNAAYYFNPYSVDKTVNVIKYVLENKELQESLIQKGFERIKKFSWERMARETLEIYNNIKNEK